MESLYKKILIFVSLLIFLGALVYRCYSLNWIGAIITLILVGISFFIFIRSKLLLNSFESKKCLFRPIYLAAYLIPFILCWLVLAKSGTADAITSPWQTVPWYFFIFYFLATSALIIHFLKKARFSRLLLFIHLFLTFSVIWVVYRIGYGYDQFIHQASMELIKGKGTIDPKPLYYLGQYALVVILSKISFIPIIALDKILVPTAAAFLAAPAIYLFARKKWPDQRSLLLSILFLLALPFSFLTFTTPQNLSYIFLLTTIFYALAQEKKDLPIAYLLAAATFLIHPVSGIPALIFVLALHAYSWKNILFKRIVLLLSFLAAALALPASFWLIKQNSIASLSWKGGAISFPVFPNSENIFLNFVYFFQQNIGWIIFALALATVALIWKKRRESSALLINAGLALAFFFSYFLTKTLSFDFLIDYERLDYPERILTVAMIILLPPVLALFYSLVRRILSQNAKIKYPLLIFLALLLTASLYLAYPRKDNYFDARGLSVSTADLEAVSWIEKDAGASPYVVLADQQVSVAALRRIGFRYLDNGQFFYPIPTGGELYKYYLAMVYEEADREPMLRAMDFGRTETAYFVLNEYWWAFDKILKEAKLSADDFIEINAGEIYIFKYQK